MERQEFEKVYTEYYDKILSFVRKRISNFYDAEELTGDVFFNFYCSLERYDVKRSSVATWLYVIAANRLKNYYRDKKEHISMQDLEHQMTDSQDAPEEIVIFLLRREALKSGLSELSQKERDVLVFKYYMNLNSKEIAANMGMSDGNVRMLQKRSLNKLRRIMERQGR